jgi:thioredoxin-dependent peroxiredoxin
MQALRTHNPSTRWLAALALGAIGTIAQAADLAVGDPAPDFTLEATDGKTYHLADFAGKQTVVLAWFPRAYTSGCTIECKSLAEHGDLIEQYDVTYFMASVDPLDKNKGFAEEQHADFPLLSDPTKATAKAYGVLNVMGIASRQTFFIGADGKVLAIDRNVNPATAAEDIAARLGELNTPKRP